MRILLLPRLLQCTRLRTFTCVFTNHVNYRCYTEVRKDDGSQDDSPVPRKLLDSRLYQFEEWVLSWLRSMTPSWLIKWRSGSKRARKSQLGVAAANLYNCVSDVNVKEFFTVFRMPDTFQSFYTVHVLHFWMCLVRLGKEGDAGNFVSKAMKRIFVQDMRDRMGMFDQMSSKVTRQNRNILDGQFLTDILSYEEAIVSHDIILAGVMWRRILSTSDAAKVDPVLMALLVEYVRKQVHHLDHVNSEQLLKAGKITWLPLSSDYL